MSGIKTIRPYFGNYMSDAIDIVFPKSFPKKADVGKLIGWVESAARTMHNASAYAVRYGTEYGILIVSRPLEITTVKNLVKTAADNPALNGMEIMVSIPGVLAPKQKQTICTFVGLNWDNREYTIENAIKAIEAI